MAVHYALLVKSLKKKKLRIKKKKYAAQVDDGSRGEFGRNHIKPGKEKPPSIVTEQLSNQIK